MRTMIPILSLLLSFSAFSQANVFPQLINMGNSVQVQIFNNTQDNLRCSGNVFMTTQLGNSETRFYMDFINKNGFSMRNFYLMNFNDRVNFSYHSIYCQKAP